MEMFMLDSYFIEILETIQLCAKNNVINKYVYLIYMYRYTYKYMDI